MLDEAEEWFTDPPTDHHPQLAVVLAETLCDEESDCDAEYEFETSKAICVQ